MIVDYPTEGWRLSLMMVALGLLGVLGVFFMLAV
jgi:hypothetical protein